MMDYKSELNQRYWEYQKSYFSNLEKFFDCPYANNGRPPVFIRSEAWRNVIINPDANCDEKNELLCLIPKGERHKWFGSMNSSQALAQSVFGNLAVYGFLLCLAELKSDENLELFGKAQVLLDNFKMEHKIKHLGEPRSTSLDGYISGDYQVAIECKFTEAEVGTCSRSRLSRDDASHCDGTYSRQKNRIERCSLTEIGVCYWHFVSQLFMWDSDSNLSPCPLNTNYQLVRNVLAVGVKPDKTVSLNGGHVLLVYDERNPAFQKGGKGLAAYVETRGALRNPEMLRKCSWQKIVQHIRKSISASLWAMRCAR